MDVDRGLFHQYGGYWLECNPEINVLSVTDASLDTSGAVGAESNLVVLAVEDIVLLATFHLHVSKTLSVFKAFDGIDAEHGIAQSGMKLAEDWLSQSDGASLNDTADDPADSITFPFGLVDVIGHLLGQFLVGAAYGIVFDGTQVILV